VEPGVDVDRVVTAIAATVVFVPRVDLVVAAVATVVLAVEPTPPILLLAVPLVVLGRAGVGLLGAFDDLLSLFLLFIIVEILWE